MATSSKDIETLWNRYTNEGSKHGISVAQFFESNGVPYHVFEKLYKKRMQTSAINEQPAYRYRTHDNAIAV